MPRPAAPTTVRRRPRPSPLVGELLRFGVVGVVGFVVDYGTYRGLVAAGVVPDAAKAVSFVAGTAVAYVLNRRWTYGGSGATTGGARAVRAFALLYAATFAVNVGTNAALLRLLAGPVPDRGWQLTLAFVVAQGLTSALNFAGLRWWVFRSPAGGALAGTLRHRGLR